MFGRNKKEKECKHKFEYIDTVVLDGKFIRLVWLCKRCSKSIHTSVKSYKEFKSEEREDD